MTEKLKLCPFCGGEAFIATVEHSAENRPNGYRFHGEIMCRKCQATAGTTGFDETYEIATEKAIAAWNRRPPARKLTLDELRGMDGQPVWVSDGFFADVESIWLSGFEVCDRPPGGDGQ